MTIAPVNARPPVKELATRVRNIRESEHVRYLCCGGICALANNLILIGGTWLGYSYVALTVLATFVGGTIGYKLHVRYSFRARARWRAYAQFLSGMTAGMLLTIAMLALLTNALSLPMWIASLTTTIVMTLYNYVIAKLVILGRLINRRVSSLTMK